MQTDQWQEKPLLTGRPSKGPHVISHNVFVFFFFLFKSLKTNTRKKNKKWGIPYTYQLHLKHIWTAVSHMKCCSSKWLPKRKRKVCGTNIYDILDFPGTIAEQRNKKVVKKKNYSKASWLLANKSISKFSWYTHFEQYGGKKDETQDKKDQTVSMSPGSSSLSVTNSRRTWITCSMATKT